MFDSITYLNWTPTLSGNDVVWCGCNNGYLPQKKVGKKLDYMFKYYCRFNSQHNWRDQRYMTIS